MTELIFRSVDSVVSSGLFASAFRFEVLVVDLVQDVSPYTKTDSQYTENTCSFD